MIFTVLLIVVGVTALVYTLATPAKISIENDKKSAAALAQAKEALIGYAAADNRPGSLPCPDSTNNGSAGTPFPTDCPGYVTGSNVYVGRLPWRTLGLPDLRDGNGERLWYAISREYARNSSSCGSCPLNSNTAGQLTISGGLSGVIAIVFSPGAIVSPQLRNTANENIVAHYLEGGNENGATTSIFYTSSASPFNDKLLPITSDALFPAVTMRVAREMRTVLRAYYTANGKFPYANPYTVADYSCKTDTLQGRIPLILKNPPDCVADADSWSGTYALPTWFQTNNWHQLVFYAVDSTCASGSCGLLDAPPATGLDLGLSSPVRALVFVTGRALSGQNPICTTASDCLDPLPTIPTNENYNGDTVFKSPALSPTNNDRVAIVSP